MTERPGFRQIWISEAAFRRFGGVTGTGQPPSGGVAQIPPGQGTSACGLVIVYNPQGDIIDVHCGGGGCGFIDWLLGRSCKAVDTGSSLYCTCVGGWWDRLFGGP